MSYINDTTQIQETYNNLRVNNPNVSVPINGTNIILTDWYFIHLTDRPPYNSDTEKLVEGTPLKFGNHYDQFWDVVPLTQQEMDDNLQQAKDNKYREIWEYYEDLVADTQEASDDSKQNNKGYNLQKKSDKRLTKKSKGQPLTPAEAADEDAYDGFLDWSDDNHDLADNGEDAVELMTLPSTVAAFDVETDIAWTSYTWP